MGGSNHRRGKSSKTASAPTCPLGHTATLYAHSVGTCLSLMEWCCHDDQRQPPRMLIRDGLNLLGARRSILASDLFALSFLCHVGDDAVMCGVQQSGWGPTAP